MRKWLRVLRENKGLSQTNMAEKLGLSRQGYSNIESGKRQADLNLSITSKLANIFGISIDEIVQMEKEKKETA